MRNIIMEGGLVAPLVATGCMRLAELNKSQVSALVHASIESQGNFFDLADIYGDGRCEELFGEVLQSETDIDREDLIIQTKCGIRKNPYRYDLSPEYIHQSIEGSLRRLKCDYIDIFTLHRPDILTSWVEIADALMEEHHLGHIRHVAVSNFSVNQIKALGCHLGIPICANQLQLSLVHAPIVAASFENNMYETDGVGSALGLHDYCVNHDVVLQAWSPLQKSNWGGLFLTDSNYAHLNQLLQHIGDKYNCTPAAVAAAWVLTISGKNQVISGTTSVTHLKEFMQAGDLVLEHEDWYELYVAAGHRLP